MASYAPLFAHSEAWQWAPDLIWVDNLNVYGTPNYFVQKLFSVNKGTHVLEVLLNNKPICATEGLYASSVMDTLKRELIVKVVNTADRAQLKTISFDGNKQLAKTASVTKMHGDAAAKNTFDRPQEIAPLQEELKVANKQLTLRLESNSFTVIKVKYK